MTMVLGFKWVLIGFVALSLGLACDAGAQTVQAGSDQQAEITAPVYSTAAVSKKGKKHKHHKKAGKHGHKKGHGKGKKGK
jgi:hypothetical protein